MREKVKPSIWSSGQSCPSEPSLSLLGPVVAIVPRQWLRSLDLEDREEKHIGGVLGKVLRKSNHEDSRMLESLCDLATHPLGCFLSFGASNRSLLTDKSLLAGRHERTNIRDLRGNTVKDLSWHRASDLGRRFQ